MPDPIIRFKRSSIPGKKPAIEQLPSGEIALNTHDGEIYIRRERSGVGTDIVSVSAGATVTNIIYVTKDGNDNNTGKKLGDAKATIKNAVENAEEGSIIKISAGVYEEDNPITVPKQVSIFGDSLREVSVKPLNDNDLFRVGNGNYITNISFISDGPMPNTSIVAFDPTKPQFINQSPYVQNCTNFIDSSIGLKIDGRHAIGPTKSMVLDSFTQYNPNGIGASITNSAYAQLVSMFTICTDMAVYCGSGGACDLTNSNSSFGNYGLVAEGVGALQYTGLSINNNDPGFDTITLDLSAPVLGVSTASYDNLSGELIIQTTSDHNYNVGMAVNISGLGFTCSSGPGIVTYPSGSSGYVFNISQINSSDTFKTYVGISTLEHFYVSGGSVRPDVVRPFDGQVVYFDKLYYEIDRVNVSYGGTGYTNNTTINFQSPSTSWGVPAQATLEVVNGSITNVNIVSSGRGYQSVPAILISPPEGSTDLASLEVVIRPKYYLILSSTQITNDFCTIQLNDNVPYSVGIGTTAYFFKQSRLLASSHSFEYIGSGTDIDTALPVYGGVPVQENETRSIDGGLVVYTSTDHSGNFRVGDGVVINQATGTISGTFYSKSLFSTMTPFILALGGD
jgi:hypothetical protein